jgi:hypothetical protein
MPGGSRRHWRITLSKIPPSIIPIVKQDKPDKGHDDRKPDDKENLITRKTLYEFDEKLVSHSSSSPATLTLTLGKIVLESLKRNRALNNPESIPAPATQKIGLSYHRPSLFIISAFDEDSQR